MDEENSLYEQSVEVEEPESVEPNQKKAKLTSKVWDYFKRIGKAEDGIERAICKGCKTATFKVGYTLNGKNYGTSHLHRHKEVCPHLKFHDVGHMFINQEGKLKSRKIDQQTHRGKLAEAIIKHNLPYSFVEYDGIRDWVNYISPDVVMPSRNTEVADVKKVYIREKEILKQTLAKILNRVCLTSDCWTSSTSEGYICLTAQFVDENWRLNCRILNFCRMYPPHTGVEMSAVIYDHLKEWNIDKKVFSITLDNATANDSLQNILKGHLRLQNSLLCDGEFFHVRCSAHILNLIVQEGLKEASDSLFAIRESVKHVRGSDGRIQKFEQCVKQVGIDTNRGLCLDVSTRWNSTYLMLESVLPYEKVFNSLHLHDRNYTSCPTLEQWRIAEKICEVLEPFHEITNLISGSSYLTSNLYFMQVWRIECMLKEKLNDEVKVIKDMASRMHEKFEKYWAEYNVVLAFGAILDPHMKLQFLNFCYSKLDPSSAHEKIGHVKDKLYKLYKYYANRQIGVNGSFSVLTTSSEERSKSKGSKLFREFKAFDIETAFSNGKSELDLYLEEPKLDLERFQEMDVVMYWRDYSGRYPDLSVMARDVLSIPITTVASESAFSIGGRVLTKYRSCIHHDNVQKLVTTRNWLHGFTQKQTNIDENEDIMTTLLQEDPDVHDEEVVELDKLW